MLVKLVTIYKIVHFICFQVFFMWDANLQYSEELYLGCPVYRENESMGGASVSMVV